MEFLDLTNPSARQEYERFLESQPLGNFMQSPGWAQLKSPGWGSEAVVLRDNTGAIRASMLVLVRRLPIGVSLLYSPRGPVGNLADHTVLEGLLEGARALARKYRAYLFRIDPCVVADDGAFIALARELGFRFTPDMGDFTTIQARNNYMLDLRGKTEEELLQSFASKWRYNIRLAQRKGVECRVCGPEGLDDFYPLMEETGRRDQFIIRPKAYFAKMLRELGEHCRLYLCYYEGQAVSGAIAVQYAGKTAYVYGASTARNRGVMPNHLMQWTMIRWALEGGCSFYDFQAIPHYKEPEHPNYGVYRFKQGFNGQVVEFAGEFDYVFRPAALWVVNRLEQGVRLLRSLQKRLRR